MKIPEEIIKKADKLKVSDKINWNAVFYSKREPSRVIRNITEEYGFAILGKGSVDNFYEQPLVVIPLNDYLAQLKGAK